MKSYTLLVVFIIGLYTHAQNTIISVPIPGGSYTITGGGGNCTTPNGIPFNVSDVGILNNGANQLMQVDISLNTACGNRLTDLGVWLKAPDGTCTAVSTAMGGSNLISPNGNRMDYSFVPREETECLDKSAASILSAGGSEYRRDQTGRFGFFRSTGNWTTDFNGADADGEWTLYVVSPGSGYPCLIEAYLVFGDPTPFDGTAPATGNTCSSAVEWEGGPICLTTTGRTGSASMPGFPGITQISGESCGWNASNDNDSWLRFVPVETDVCIAISGLMENTQSIIVKATGPTSCTSLHPGGGNDTRWEVVSCPNPEIYGATSGTARNHNHCFTAIVGEEYYLVVDGLNGAETDYFISSVSGLQIITPPVVTCPSNFSVCEGSAAFELTGGSPVGGDYTGTGVVGNDFDPNVAGVGDHVITYEYDDGLGGGPASCNFTITVTPNNTAGVASSNPTLCINTALTDITHTTTGATGISNNGVDGANGLPAGVSASWAGDLITISGTPAAGGTFNYSIPLTGGCGTVNATGTIIVTPDNTANAPSSSPTLCINTALTDITHTTTGATGISNNGVDGTNGLPAGVSASWAGDLITISGTPAASGTFNYSIPLTGGCGTVNATGTITVVATPQVDEPAAVSECDGYELPALINGAYYANSGGIDPIAVGTEITSTQTVYVYNESGTTPNCTNEHAFEITIHTTPLVDEPTDLSTCDRYELPALTNGAYFQSTGGVDPIAVGAEITSSQTVYVYNESGTTPNCTNEHAFEITIHTTPLVDEPTDLSTCDRYELPALTNGAYFQSTGGVDPIAVGTEITSTQNVYVYNESGTTPNCTNEHMFEITIYNSPEIDVLANQEHCDNYELPAIIGANLSGDQAYYEEPNGQGNKINAGEIINYEDYLAYPITLYIYDETGTVPNCSDEQSFELIINSSPVLNPIEDVEECDAFRLPEIEGEFLSGNEAYYTAPNGTGDVFLPNSTIEYETMPSNPLTLYVYDETGTTPNCWGEEGFVLTLHPTPDFELEAQTPSACDLEDGSITITGLENETDYQVTYTDGVVTEEPELLTSNNQGKIILANLGAGNYSVTLELTVGDCGTVTETITLINPDAPQIDPFTPVAVCDSYVVPEITGAHLTGSEAYYDEPNGQGNVVAVGTLITTSTTLYAYDVDGDCSDEEVLAITIHHTPVLEEVEDVNVCGEFTLPEIEGEELVSPIYSTSPGGQGTTYAPGATVAVNEFTMYPTTIYIYDEVAGTDCNAQTSFELTIRPYPTATISGSGGTYCSYQKPSDIIVNVTGSPSWELTFTVDGEEFIVTSTTSPIVLPGSEGVYELVSLSDAHCTSDVSGVASAEIIIKPTPEPPVVEPTWDHCTNSEFEVMEATGEGQITWYLEDETTPYATGNTAVAQDQLGETTYYVTASLDGCESEATEVIVNVIACDIVIPEAFTPNGDGYNDVFYIENLEAYPNTRVVIFNRWGAELYVSDDYANNWDGRSENQFNVGGNIVPEGTYYYLIELGGPVEHEMHGKVFKGWIYIKP